jgi:hypothetical protein
MWRRTSGRDSHVITTPVSLHGTTATAGQNRRQQGDGAAKHAPCSAQRRQAAEAGALGEHVSQRQITRILRHKQPRVADLTPHAASDNHTGYRSDLTLESVRRLSAATRASMALLSDVTEAFSRPSST